MNQAISNVSPSTSDFLAGGGEMGACMRAFDWNSTPLGPVESWSTALRMIVRLLLANRFPMLLWWGPQYVSIYNDPYAPILGAKHPWALSRPVHECWSEIWHVLKPLIDTPFNGGPSTWNEDLSVEINRHGFLEEGHFTVAYSPVPDESVSSGIGGVLATVHEITEKILGERRVMALRDLGARLSDAKAAEEACTIAAAVLAAYDKDVPFALFYLIEANGSRARLAGAAGVEIGEPISPMGVDLRNSEDLGWPFVEAIRTETVQVVERLADRFPGSVPRGPWSDPPHTAVVVPVPSNRAHEPAALIVAGVSARLKLDEYYRDFFDLVRVQVATAIANARAYEEEKKRAEALAEIDRAKTAFFSNVSHEFRTPLTLLVSPIEDGLADASTPLPTVHRERQAIAYRNALRLLRLVNTLLDFSRLEAGRLEAVYEPTELSTLTSELASNFRSACERAGIALIVRCPPLREPVYVDRDMWEKIVLNFLSNAFKFTFEGEIEIALREIDDAVELTVRDTGSGIPADEIPHLFERFHRVKNVRARTHEGTGIGLALVKELVNLHAGCVSVESHPGRGSTFTASIPTGTAHLPQAKIGSTRALQSTALGAVPFVEEALRWLPDSESLSTDPTGKDTNEAVNRSDASSTSRIHHSGARASARRPRILWADDNADMREYVRRLLSPLHDVESVGDGVTALAAATTKRPDLVLADVMMPGLDGFGLLRELRANPETSTTPVILLSARAGEEARVEGMDAGADDYLVKPFSARELLARVRAHLEIARVRREVELVLRESEQRMRLAMDAAQMFSWEINVETGESAVSGNMAQVLGFSLERPYDVAAATANFLPSEDAQRFTAALRSTERGDGDLRLEYAVIHPDTGETLWLESAGTLIERSGESPTRVVGISRNITDRKRIEREREQLLDREQAARAQAEAASRLKDEFLSVLSHELRTPLNSILLWSRMLRRDRAIGPERLGRALEVIERNTRVQAQLTEDLLDLSTIVSGKLRLHTASTELTSVVAAAVETVRPAAEAKGLTLDLRLPKELTVVVDGERIQQIVWNLLSNAVKFTPAGGHIQIELEAGGSFAEISVRDTGHGITADFLPHVFERFRQADSTTSRRHGGLGLGLAIVRELAEAHGGAVRAESDGEGRGATFTVSLPLRAGVMQAFEHEAQFAENARDLDSQGGEPALSGVHVLVADDDLDTRELLMVLLDEHGATVTAVGSVAAALQVVSHQQPDVLIADIGMPGDDGYALIRRLRAAEAAARGEKLPAIALTAYASAGDRQKALAAGYDRHLPKPVDSDALVRTILNLIGKITQGV